MRHSVWHEQTKAQVRHPGAHLLQRPHLELRLLLRLLLQLRLLQLRLVLQQLRGQVGVAGKLGELARHARNALAPLQRRRRQLRVDERRLRLHMHPQQSAMSFGTAHRTHAGKRCSCD